jgi:hypothetical protein
MSATPEDFVTISDAQTLLIGIDSIRFSTSCRRGCNGNSILGEAAASLSVS